MPLVYTTPKEVAPAKTGTKVWCVGVNIRQPRMGSATITYYYEAVDAAGNVVETRPLTVTVAQIQAEKPTAFATVYGILKIDAYERAQTVFPSGTVT